MRQVKQNRHFAEKRTWFADHRHLGVAADDFDRSLGQNIESARRQSLGQKDRSCRNRFLPAGFRVFENRLHHNPCTHLAEQTLMEAICPAATSVELKASANALRTM